MRTLIVITATEQQSVKLRNQTSAVFLTIPPHKTVNLDSDLDSLLLRGICLSTLFYNPPAPQALGGLKVDIQIFSYRLAKPSKPVFSPKVEKSDAN